MSADPNVLQPAARLLAESPSRLSLLEAQQQIKPVPLALPIPAAVALSGLSRSRLYLEAKAGNLPLRKVGSRTIILTEDLLKLLHSLPRAEVGPEDSRREERPLRAEAAE
jgi:hypothetical protein